MPARNRTRVISGGPQGGDASMTIVIPTVAEMRYPQEIIDDFGPSSEEAVQAANDYLVAHILHWNWVGDDGNPLPQPKDNPDVFDQLTQEEIKFVGQSLNGESQEAAEKRKKSQR